jgi:hypothetical protein
LAIVETGVGAIRFAQNWRSFARSKMGKARENVADLRRPRVKNRRLLARTPRFSVAVPKLIEMAGGEWPAANYLFLTPDS